MLVSRAVLQLAAALTLTLAFVNVSLAGPVERMADVALHPTNPNVVVLRYENGGTGLLYSSDGGKNFKLLCSSAIDRGKVNGPTAVTKDGHVLLGTFEGMWRDDGKGCGWSKIAPLTGRWITDIVTDPIDPEQILTVSGNGGAGVRNGLIRSTSPDEWADIGSQDELGITRIRGIKTASGVRFYQSVLRVESMPGDAGASTTKYAIRVSDDEGKTWRDHEVTVADASGSFRLEAIDPTNPDRLVGSIVSERDVDRVLVSTNQGETFTPYLEVSELGGVAFAPDGRLWIGEPTSLSMSGASRGLWYAPNLDAKPTKVFSDDGVECVAYQPATDSLLACRSFSFGKFNTTDWTFTESFHFKTAKEFVTCDGMDMVATCEAQLCADFCGAGHFAQSALCCAYNTSSCGPEIAESEGTGGPEMCEGGGRAGTGASAAAGRTGSAGAAATGAAGRVSGSAGAAGTSSAAAPTAGSTPTPPEKDDDGGCSATPGQQGAGPRGLALLGVFGLALILRRRQRQHGW